MTISLSLDTKNTATVTNDDKGYDHTWDEATFTWDGAEGSTWDTQRLLVTEEAKNNTTITNETKI